MSKSQGNCNGDCAHCGKRNAPMACPNCSTAYCNARCQGDDWQYHKTYACEKGVVDSKKKGVEYLVPSTNPVKGEPAAVVPFGQGCNCGRTHCEHQGPFSLNRPMMGRMSFMGILSMPDGRYLKLDNPRDFGISGTDRRPRSGGPGHYMTATEFMSECVHCDNFTGDWKETHNMRDISSLLVDFGGRKKGGDINPLMYPFHAKLKPPYKNSKPPKIRSEDVVTVVVSKELKLSDDFSIAPKDTVQVYVVSFTSSGVVTGVIETNAEQYWVYFMHHCVRQLVKRGKHWQ